MYKKQFSLLFILFFLVQAVYPNIKLFPGYYIDKQGDSILCEVAFNDWVKNPLTINVQVNNAMHEFSASEIQAFGVYGYCEYRSVNVTYHLNPILGSSFPEEFSDSVETNVCFLKVLEKSYYSLYHLVLPAREYFFISYPGKTVSELVYRVKEKSDTISDDLNYRRVLTDLFVHEGLAGKYSSRLEKVSYNRLEISSLIRILNETHTGVKQQKSSAAKDFQASGNFQIDLFAGGVGNSFPSHFDGDYSTMNQFKSAYSPSGGVSVLYSLPGDFKSFKLGLSTGYDGYKRNIDNQGTSTTTQSVNYYYTAVYSEHMSLSNSLLFIHAYIMYMINPLSRTKIYVKGGLSYSYSLAGNVSIDIKDTATITGVKNGNVPFSETASGSHTLISLRGDHLSPLAGAGVAMGRSKLEFTYSSPVNVANTGSQSFKIGYMGVYYYFSLLQGNHANPPGHADNTH